MTHFNQHRPCQRTVKLFDPGTDEIMQAAKAARASAEKIAFVLGIAVGAGITLVIVGLLR